MKAQITIVMGSESDLPTMREAALILKDFKVGHEMRVLSAHRVPEETSQYAKGLAKRGVKAVIAGAGGSAALAGFIASVTPLPVIGVPIQTSSLNGLDSLLSTVQMPPGVPVGAVAIGKSGAKNAALLALRILGVTDTSVRNKLEKYKKQRAQKILKTKVKA